MAEISISIGQVTASMVIQPIFAAGGPITFAAV